ncbi:MAG: LuxR C-terminal-related transcriptional regulator [Eubacteriales bacterium]|nr:LuxR C-terminal-related transcriptional regulator [Eubacteriales bacterium]MDD4583659.1 LuxR C-terminal-related transcriptional regulator [Eubacteriales bacterium]
MVNFDFADFYLNDTKAVGKILLVDPVVVSRYSQSFNQRFMMEYDKYYGQIDYVKWVFSSQESVVYRDSDLIDHEMRTKSAFYLDYLKPAGLINVAGISIAVNGSCVGAMTLYRTEKNGDFTDRDLYILKQLLPHLQNKFMEEYEEIESIIHKNGFNLLSRIYKLTKREMEITELLYNGKSNNEISHQLSISVNTVKKHISNIFNKLGVDSRSQLINFLITNCKEVL